MSPPNKSDACDASPAICYLDRGAGTARSNPRFFHFDGLDYLAGARQALLEKLVKEFLSRIGGDNFVDGFLHGSRIPLR
jgi:hypothetical protein